MPISALDFRYPVICSAFARLSFLHWFRDQLRPGRHNFKVFDRFVFSHALLVCTESFDDNTGSTSGSHWSKIRPISPSYAPLVQGFEEF